MVFNDLDQEFDIDSRNYFSNELEKLTPMIEDELLIRDEKGIHITEKGRLLVRNACMVFDTYLNANILQTYSASADANNNRPRFSKAI